MRSALQVLDGLGDGLPLADIRVEFEFDTSIAAKTLTRPIRRARDSPLLPKSRTESRSVFPFCRSFSWALLRANSCARQLRVFCFPGSSRTLPGPSRNAAAHFGSSGPRSGVPQENGAKKG